MTTQTPMVNLEGFSMTLKEQSGKKKVLDVITYSMEIILNVKIGG